MSRPHGSSPLSSRYGSSGSVAGRRPRPGRLASAASGTTQGETEVAKDLPRNGPSGTYSHAWMSRADQSLTRHDAEDVLGEGVERRPAGPSPVGDPTTKPTSASMSSRCGRPERRCRRSVAVRWPRGPHDGGAGRRPRCRPGRGSRSAGASSSGSAARASGRNIRPEVLGVVLGGVEVDVVGDRRTAGAVTASATAPDAARRAARCAASASQAVTCARSSAHACRPGARKALRLRRRRSGVRRGRARRDAGQVEDEIADPRRRPGRRAGAVDEDAVRQVAPGRTGVRAAGRASRAWRRSRSRRAADGQQAQRDAGRRAARGCCRCRTR